ncbi:MAG TPA: class I SAM-dependent methyltransferase [Candidatus Udaeobacter sp.]|jgi:SAM-dependent methyltransferase|nr:class I SAM-dependent methyltransferase [Candidatus Udaeobacter sp.]
MSAPEPAKIQVLREQLHQEWTGDRTVAAWRKWHSQIAAFTRGATDALVEAAHLRPGQRVLELACGVGDPALSIAAEIAPSGSVTATDLGPGMMSLAEELARKKGLTNIEFREANAESLPFPDASYDRLTCRFGIMFFPDLPRALRECFRVLKPGGRAVFVAWGKKEQPFFTTTAGIVLKHVPAPPPPPDPDGPSLFMFGERGRLRRALETAGFSNLHEEYRIIAGRWASTAEKYWEQFTEVAAPFRPLIDQLPPEKLAQAKTEILTSLNKFWNGKELNMPLEIVIGSGTRP